MHVLHDAVRLIPSCVTLPPHSSGMWSQLQPGLCSRCSPDLPGRIWQTSGDGTAQDSAPRKNSSKGEKEHRTTQVCSGTKPQGPEGRGESESYVNPRQRWGCRYKFEELFHQNLWMTLVQKAIRLDLHLSVPQNMEWSLLLTSMYSSVCSCPSR